jgi:hypothetical protein
MSEDGRVDCAVRALTVATTWIIEPYFERSGHISVGVEDRYDPLALFLVPE